MGHRAYYPAYKFYEGELKDDFQIFINPLLDNLSRRINFNSFGDYLSDYIIPTDGASDGSILTYDSSTDTFTWQDPASSLLLIQTEGVDNVDQTLLNFIGGTNITVTDNADGSVTIDGAAGYSDEQAQDTIGAILTDTSTINFTYTDATPSITADVLYQMSITADSSGLKFVNDAASPTQQYHYGTNISGTKGWNQNFIIYNANDTFWTPYLTTYTGTGINNILLGEDIGEALTTGYSLVGLGSNNLIATQTGNRSIAIGLNNLNGAFTSNDNVAIGRGNLAVHNGSSGANVAIGTSTLAALTSGFESIAIGFLAGSTATTSYNSIYMGSEAGRGVTTGIQNIVLSHYSELLTTSNRNVLIGAAIGQVTGDSYAPADFNTIVGQNASLGGNYSNSIGIGAGSHITANNQCTIGGSRGDQQITDFIFGGPSRRQTGNPISTGDDGLQKDFLWRIPERYNATSAADLAGHNLIIRAGLGTGAGAGGGVKLQVSGTGAASTTVNTEIDSVELLGDTGDVKLAQYPSTRNDDVTDFANLLGTDVDGVIQSYKAQQGSYSPSLTITTGTGSVVSGSILRVANTGVISLKLELNLSAAVGGNSTVTFAEPNGSISTAVGTITFQDRSKTLCDSITLEDNGSGEFYLRFGTVNADWIGNETVYVTYQYID